MFRPLLAAAALMLPLSASAAAPPAPPPVPDVTARDLRWLRTNLIDAYDKHGRKDPKWDADVREALEATVKWWGDDPDADLDEADRVFVLSGKAIAAGCTDPLVRMMRVVSGWGTWDPAWRADFETEVKPLAEIIADAPYHPLLRCRAQLLIVHLRRGKCEEAREYSDEFLRDARARTDSALDLLGRGGQDPAATSGRVLRLALLAVDELMPLHRRDRTQVVERVAAALEKADRRAATLAFRGHQMTKSAWDARGSGWAKDVNEKGWKLFGERLLEAEALLKKAWELDKVGTEVPRYMLTVELGLNRGHGNLELWFERVMRRNPYHADACEAKLYYLEPKWYGSEDGREMLEFARRLRKDQPPANPVTLLIVDAHETLAGYQKDRAEYLARPEVWAEIRTAYLDHLAAKPRSVAARSRFAWLAHKFGKHEDAHKQFEILGNRARFGTFGGRNQYLRMKFLSAEAVDKSGGGK